MTIRLGVDTGGTFTDVVLYDEDSGEIHITKTPSTPPNFDEGVLNGIDKILAQTESLSQNVSFLSHGTTVGTNAVLEDDIPKLGLITNEGLRDVLEIGDQTRPELYNLQIDKPPALIPRSHRREVAGRINAQGNVVDELDENQAKEAIHALVEDDVDSIVVSMLFSYLNGDHERRIGELIEQTDESTSYALSSAVYPETREYDRTVTTVLNEAVKVRIEDYIKRLDSGIDERGLDVPLNIMHSGGGIFGREQATEFAIRTVLSGPAAGAVATRDVSRTEDYNYVIGLDMGGTSADVSIIEDGEIVRSTEGEINNLPINTPLIDIHTVGAGGGSIAWVDKAGGLRVGPESAGADPGPICYGRGGTSPTVTDANLVLGRINPKGFLEGDIEAAAKQAEEILKTQIAEPLDESVEEAALSVLKVANAKMSREIRRVTVERGRDPAEFSLAAFGGAGPLQAAAVGHQMEMNSLIIPRSPGVFSARGLLLADVRMDESEAYRGRQPHAETVRDQFADLESVLRDRFTNQGFESGLSIEKHLDLRYKGQSYELTVPVAGEILAEETLTETIQQFHKAHEQLYGYAMEGEPVEVITLRASGHIATPPMTDHIDVPTANAIHDTREVYFEGHGYVAIDVYWRPYLTVGSRIDGPAIIEEPGCTSLLPPATSAEVSKHGSIIISL